MKKGTLIPALALCALSAATARAEKVEYKACTSDGNTVTYAADVDGGFKGRSMKDILGEVFRSAVKEMPALTPIPKDDGKPDETYMKWETQLTRSMYYKIVDIVGAHWEGKLNPLYGPNVTPGCNLK